MTKTLRLNLLGGFEILPPDGPPVELAAKKPRALLAYLAVEAGRSHTREQLATLLWSDTGEERSRHNLRQALSKIRQRCGEVVISSGDTVSLNRSACEVDVGILERLARSQDPEELREAIGLYRGELLEGACPKETPYEEWLFPARIRLRRLACGACERLVSMLVEEDRLSEAITTLEHRLAMDPACEPAHRQLMDLLSRTGRRSDALQQYRACAEALQRELGAEPGPETRELRDRIQIGAIEAPASRAPSPAPAPAPVPAAPQAKADRPAIAVLPFENMSGPDDGYFVDGIVEEITTALSHFSSLIVIARGSAFALRDKNLPDGEIASALGAQFLVRGSVQRAGRRVRINIQLLDAVAGVEVWGRRFDREMEDVFIVQDEIASSVASTLAGRVEAARLARARKAPAERLEAFDYYLRGKEYHHRFTAEDCARCIELFETAIERDPNFATAHGWLACGYGQAINFNLDEIPRLQAKARAAARRGLELDDNDSECHRILAQVALTRRDFKRALYHQERALFLNPNDDRVVCAQGEILAFAGRAGEAEEWVRKAMRLNPYHPDRYWTHLARALFHTGRNEEAIAALERISNPRKDDLAYMVAAGALAGDSEAVERGRSALLEGGAAFDAEAFVKSLHYENERERRFLLDALAGGGLGS